MPAVSIADDLALMFSGGKDSVATYMALADTGTVPRWLVTTLVTAVGESDRRVPIHGTPVETLRLQAERLGRPLIEIPLPEGCDNATYERRIAVALEPLIAGGLRRIAFGDLFLTDIRTYREAQCAALDVEPIFPLWGRSTAALARELPARGLEACICCVDGERIDPTALGRRWNTAWLETLPEGIDPCGERGEFHTVVIDAPSFSSPIELVAGETRITRGRFHTLDLAPA